VNVRYSEFVSPAPPGIASKPASGLSFPTRSGISFDECEVALDNSEKPNLRKI